MLYVAIGCCTAEGGDLTEIYNVHYSADLTKQR